MRLDDLRPTENVDDRRGEDYGGGGGGFGGPRMVFGGGGLGLVAIVVLSLLFGVDPSALLNGGSGGGPMPMQQTQQTGPRGDDEAYRFARQIVGSAEDVWSPLLRAQGVNFSPATFTAYDNATPTGCGTGQSSAGPFYCPGDNHIYLDLAFFNELGQRFGAPGDFARAYVIAHEYGHHIQNLLGTMDRHGGRSTGAGSDSVRVELQADCYAGVWAYHANQQFNILQTG
jgi:predicted metalloprotease